MTLLNVCSKYGKVSEWLGIFSLFFLLFRGNEQQDIKSLSQHFIISQSDHAPCPLTKLMDTIEYMNGQEQSREDPDGTVQMKRLILSFAIWMQLELIITRVKHFFVLTFSMLCKHFSRQHFEIFSLISPEIEFNISCKLSPWLNHIIWEKNKKNHINLSTADSAHSVVSVKKHKSFHITVI